MKRSAWAYRWAIFMCFLVLAKPFLHAQAVEPIRWEKGMTKIEIPIDRLIIGESHNDTTSLAEGIEDLQANGKLLSQNHPTVGKDRYFWLYCEIDNQSGDDQKVYFSLDYLYWAKVFPLDSLGRAEPLYTGTMVKKSLKSVARGRDSIVAFNLLKNEKKKIYFQVLYSSSTATGFYYTMFEKDVWQENQYDTLYFDALIHGFLWMMFFYNFFLFISTKETIHLEYAFYIFSTICFLMLVGGYLRMFFVGEYPWLERWVLVLFTLGLSGYYKVMVYIAKPENCLPAFSKLLRVWIKLIYIRAILYAFCLLIEFDFLQLISYVFNLFDCLAFIVIAASLVGKGDKAAKTYLLGTLCMIGGSLVVLFAQFFGKDIEMGFNFFKVGIASEIFLFAVGLSFRYQEKENSVKEAQENLIAQLKENEALKTKVNRELEAKVKERTREIEQQSEEIAAQRDHIEAESQKSEKLLLNILPWETALELKETGRATPKAYDKVSVLFTDFKGFTNIAEKMGEEEVVANLDYCFRAFDKICSKHNLEKIKTIGDAYMCAGGIPTKNDSNPQDAINAAQEMMEFMRKWKQEKNAKGEEAWEVRLGIHTGKVVTGVVGEDKFAYDIWGDAVNIASRMESSGEPGRINISGDTYELVKGIFKCTYRGKIEAKNKGEVDMYFVEGML